jgi:hypothetical protein
MAAPDPFGFSLLLDDGDLSLRDGGLELVRGRDNLLQALVVRVQTPFGSDRFNVTYGLDVTKAFTEPGNVRMVKDLIKLNLVRTLSADPRVRDLREVLFEDDLEFQQRHPDLSASDIRDHRHRRIWLVEVTIETVNDQTENLAVKVGV